MFIGVLAYYESYFKRYLLMLCHLHLNVFKDHLQRLHAYKKRIKSTAMVEFTMSATQRIPL